MFDKDVDRQIAKKAVCSDTKSTKKLCHFQSPMSFVEKNKGERKVKTGT